MKQLFANLARETDKIFSETTHRSVKVFVINASTFFAQNTLFSLHKKKLCFTSKIVFPTVRKFSVHIRCQREAEPTRIWADFRLVRCVSGNANKIPINLQKSSWSFKRKVFLCVLWNFANLKETNYVIAMRIKILAHDLCSLWLTSTDEEEISMTLRRITFDLWATLRVPPDLKGYQKTSSQFHRAWLS